MTRIEPRYFVLLISGRIIKNIHEFRFVAQVEDYLLNHKEERCLCLKLDEYGLSVMSLD